MLTDQTNCAFNDLWFDDLNWLHRQRRRYGNRFYFSSRLRHFFDNIRRFYFLRFFSWFFNRFGGHRIQQSRNAALNSSAARCSSRFGYYDRQQ